MSLVGSPDSSDEVPVASVADDGVSGPPPYAVVHPAVVRDPIINRDRNIKIVLPGFFAAAALLALALVMLLWNRAKTSIQSKFQTNLGYKIGGGIGGAILGGVGGVGLRCTIRNHEKFKQEMNERVEISIEEEVTLRAVEQNPLEFYRYAHKGKKTNGENVLVYDTFGGGTHTGTHKQVTPLISTFRRDVLRAKAELKKLKAEKVNIEKNICKNKKTLGEICKNKEKLGEVITSSYGRTPEQISKDINSGLKKDKEKLKKINLEIPKKEKALDDAQKALLKDVGQQEIGLSSDKVCCVLNPQTLSSKAEPARGTEPGDTIDLGEEVVSMFKFKEAFGENSHLVANIHRIILVERGDNGEFKNSEIVDLSNKSAEFVEEIIGEARKKGFEVEGMTMDKFHGNLSDILDRDQISFYSACDGVNVLKDLLAIYDAMKNPACPVGSDVKPDNICFVRVRYPDRAEGEIQLRLIDCEIDRRKVLEELPKNCTAADRSVPDLSLYHTLQSSSLGHPRVSPKDQSIHALKRIIATAAFEFAGGERFNKATGAFEFAKGERLNAADGKINEKVLKLKKEAEELRGARDKLLKVGEAETTQGQGLKTLQERLDEIDDEAIGLARQRVQKGRQEVQKIQEIESQFYQQFLAERAFN